MILNKIRMRRAAIQNVFVKGVKNLLAAIATSASHMVAEIRGERLFYWMPVFFGAGCLAYFTHATEPRLLTGFLFSALSILVFALSKAETLRLFSFLLFMFCSGFTWSNLQTSDKNTVTLGRGMPEAIVKGDILFAEKRLTGSQFLLAVTDVSRLRHNQTPQKLRLYGKHSHLTSLQSGCLVTLKARLIPLSKPLVPGGYDSRLPAHFHQEGGRGFIQNILEVDCSGAVSFLDMLLDKMALWRYQLAAHLEQGLSPQAKGIGIALVTGLRGQIPADHKQSLRASGLAHMLAISGLHMALMTGSVFGFLRLVGAMFPRLSQTVNLAPYCAGGAMLSGLAYLLISGGGVATQRAFIMMCLVFMAVILGRFALTLRNVSLAAMVILLLAPHSVVMVSFQMSFAAVLALVAFYEGFGRRFWNSGKTGRMSRLAYWRRRVSVYFFTLLLTSLIAGAVTGYIGAYHFNMLPVNGLTANLVAMPVFGLIIMPMALCGLILLPFELSQPFFWLMSWGIEFVVKVSDLMSKNGEAIFNIPRSPPSALLLFTFGLLGLCLLHKKWRYLAILPVLAACSLMGRGAMPDVLVYGYAHQIAARQSDGSYVMMSRSNNLYVIQKWSEILGAGKPDKSDVVICRDEICALKSAHGSIARVNSPEHIVQACNQHRLVLIPVKLSQRMKDILPAGCQSKLIDRSVWRYEKGQGINLPKNGHGWTRMSDTQTGRLWMD